MRGTLKLGFFSRAAELPEKALKAAAREFKRLKKMSPQVLRQVVSNQVSFSSF